MFGNSKVNPKEVTELQVQNQKLSVENETLKFKLDGMKEKYDIVSATLREMKSADVNKLKEENKELQKELERLKFQIENDTSNIELDTENKKMIAELKICQAENKHLKELLATYRAMPDVKQMVESLSTLAVPHLSELKEFAKIISDSKLTELHTKVDKADKTMEELCDMIHRYIRFR